MTDYLGYEDLRISNDAPRTNGLQRVIYGFLDAEGSPTDADRIALLGLMQIVGELESTAREPDSERRRRGK
ncbi:hypothetical protein [Rhodococcus sp. OK302]|uniref:hypothetical protein n=1 Tax=Rhodococcus sp. OK302 TaxID=1882769 RepID=UPI000B9461C4|nr:hypothetical protein [Rhodococcus sp. OK302]